MSADRDLAFKPAYELRALIANKEISPVDLTEVYLQRIEELNPKLNAFITVSADVAREQAKEAEKAVMRGDELGPLHGLPVSVKDSLDTKGIRTTRAMLASKDTVPDRDDLSVERVKNAGAVIIGKTNLSELALVGTSGTNNVVDECRNPWDATRVTGGSSSGAAVSTAAGLCALALGVDGGGSIRVPSSFCGTFGIQPTQGRIPSAAVGSPSQWIPVRTSQTGPVARSVRDAAILLQVISGPEADDPYVINEKNPDFSSQLEEGVKGLKIAWSADYGSIVVDPEVVAITSRAAQSFADMGACVDISPWKMDIMELNETSRTLSDVSCFIRYGKFLDAWRDSMMDYSIERIEHGMTITGAQYSMALGGLEKHRHAMADFFTKFDLLLSPATAVTAFPSGQVPKVIDGKDVSALGFRSSYPFSFPVNMAGYPAASVPCGLSRDGLPVGLHVIGRKGSEATVLRACRAFEALHPWADWRPTIS